MACAAFNNERASLMKPAPARITVVGFAIASLLFPTHPLRGQDADSQYDAVHIPSGMHFPILLGDFYRTDVQYLDPHGYHMSVHYLSPDDVIISIYLNPMTSDSGNCARSLEGDFNSSVNTIMRSWPGLHSEYIAEAQPLPFTDEPGFLFEGEATQLGIDGDRHVRTALYLYRRGWWLLKFRVTLPLGSGSSWERLREAVDELAWVEFNEVPPVGITLEELLAGELPLDLCSPGAP